MDSIRVENISKSFGNLTAVDRLTLSVAQGELFGLVGSDGAGKTTTMRMLSGIMDPDEGDAWIMGRHTVKETEELKEQIGYMSQRFGLYPDLTVLENLHFYADIYGIPGKDRDERIERLLSFSNLTPFKRRHAGNLSGGMKQKLGLACALIHTPRVLFLDEPTNGVDPVSRRDFWRILYRLLKDGVTIFVATAYLDEADRCNRVGLIHRGRLLACDTPERLRGLMKGNILEIRTNNPRQSARLLRSHFPGRSVGLFGDRIHLVTDNPSVARDSTTTLLRSAGIDLIDIRQIEPNLEDVFVAMLSDNGTGHEPSPDKQDMCVNEIICCSKTQKIIPNLQISGGFAVTLSELEKRFGDFIAVNRLSLDVRKGEIFGFLGPNGAGKSTTIRMLCGILQPTGGSGTVAGFDIISEAEEIKRHIGYMSQRFSLYDDLTVEENIDFYSGIYRIAAEKKKVRKEWVLMMAGLTEHRGSRTANLSGGWKQRLALGCAILHEPPIIFLDEPTSGVDPISRRNFWDLIYHLADDGVTVFVTTHYMDEAEYCDRLGLIYRGELIAEGSPEVLKSRHMQNEPLEITPSLEDVFVSLIETRDRTESPQREFAK